MKTARAGRENSWSDAGIHTVEVESDVIVTAVGDAAEDGFHAPIMHFVGGDEMGATTGIEPDLEDVLDVVHLRGSADRARQTLAHTVDLIAPVKVLVDVDEC